MKSLIALALVSVFATSGFAQDVSRQEYNLKIKDSIANFRNDLAEAKTPKAYKAVVTEMFEHVITNSELSAEEAEFFESRASTLSDFELKDLLVSKYDQIIESGSKNFLILIDAWANDSSDQHPRRGRGRGRGRHPRNPAPRRHYTYTYHWTAWVFLFPFVLEDTQVSEDI